MYGLDVAHLQNMHDDSLTGQNMGPWPAWGIPRCRFDSYKLCSEITREVEGPSAEDLEISFLHILKRCQS